jgi:tRNA nucleotidyltransferase (CCA-adding enzyme)
MQFLENLPFDLQLLPVDAHAVGGAVRDALMGRVRDYLDLDIVVATGAIELARALATQYRAGFVLLDPEYQIARVVFDRMTLDIATQMGDSIECDLHRRDYTINAIGYHLQDRKIVDPLHGIEDLNRRSMRMVGRENLADDPLRLLRAYRQAAQLNLTIESGTIAAIRSLAPQITTVAAERVWAEVRYLLAVPNCHRDLVAAMMDGVLSAWLNPTPRPDLFHQLEAISRAEELILDRAPALATLAALPLKETIDISQSAIARLCRLLPNNRVDAERNLTNLNVSSWELKSVLTAIDYLPKLLSDELSPTELYYWFRSVDKNFPLMVILALAEGKSIDRLLPIIDRYLDPQDIIAHPQPLLTGDELMQALNIPPSPTIGKLMTAIHIERVNERITNKAEAISFARTFIEKQDLKPHL